MNNKLIIGAVLAVCASVSVCYAQTITNGSFEDGFTGWTVSGVTEVVEFGNSDGTNGVRFNAHNSAPDGVLAQTFPTIPGERYALRFDFGIFSPSEQRLAVEVRGGAIVLSNLVTEVGAVGLGMHGHLFIFTADATSTTLTFRDVSRVTVAIDCYLDNVRVELAEPHLSIRVSQVELCWLSRTSHVYQVQYRSTLTTNTWTNLGAPIPGSGPTTCTHDLVALGDPQRFYRVVIAP